MSEFEPLSAARATMENPPGTTGAPKSPAAPLLLLLSAGLLLGEWAVAAQDRYVLPPETAKLKAGPGVELANQQCLVCHSADYISTQPRLARTAWRASVQKMKDKYGAPIPADKMDALAEYLAKNYGAEIPKP